MASLLAEPSFRSLIENVQDMLVVLTADGRFLWESPSTERVLGYAPAELSGRSALEMIHPADRADARELLDRTVATPHAVGTLTYRVMHRDGSWRVMEATGKNLLHDPAVAGLVLNARDVSERVRFAEQLEAARAAAERANRAKTEFLSRMSHELRTPLHAILGFAQLLEEELERDADREGVAHITRAGRHLLQLINEVLEISRIEEGRLALSIEPVGVEEVVRQAVELVQPQSDAAGIRIRIQPAGALHLLADLQRLRQVLVNLLSNAVKYNRKGGSVDVRCVQRRRGRLRIEVRDTGPGIPADRRAALFTPFERLGAEVSGIEGVGLGLAVSRRLVEQMRGTMGLWSRVGRGSVFWVELPLSAAAAHPLPEQPASVRSPPPLRAGTVLQIEDNSANVRLMERLLGRWPQLRVLHTAEGEEGLRLARRHRPDLLVLDLHLPDLHGTEVLARLRADPALRDTPVLVVTADVTAHASATLAALSPHAVVTKPFDVEAVAGVVAEILGPVPVGPPSALTRSG